LEPAQEGGRSLCVLAAPRLNGGNPNLLLSGHAH
jgi:hypothetical protein